MSTPKLITITGSVANEQLGNALSIGGDFNGDGKADLLIGAWGGNNANGKAYIIFGKSSLTSNLPLNTFTSSQGFLLTGSGQEQFGKSVSFGGDVNGDGKADILIGANGYSTFTGRAYLIYGSSTRRNFTTSSISPSAAVVMTGESITHNVGISVSIGGDVNGDGYADMLIGANGYSSSTGRVYLVYGKNNLPSSISLGSLSSTQGITITGSSANDNFGYSVSLGGDLSGDTYADFVVGAYGATASSLANAGKVYVFFGGTSLTDLSLNTALSTSRGITILGNTAGDKIGWSVNLGKDINADGKADIVISSVDYSTATGRAIVLYGASFLADISLGSLTTSQGYRINGEATSDQAGQSVCIGNDLNGDGYGDIVIGANRFTGGSGVGRVYIIFGNPSVLYGTIALGLLTDPTAAKSYTGVADNDNTGEAVTVGGDLNGDGRADLVIGASLASSSAGAVYILTNAADTTLPPTSQPSSQPSGQPSAQPNSFPSSLPTAQPFSFPTSQPTCQPSTQPTSQPSRIPTSQPSRQPSGQPTKQPISYPSSQPTSQPTTEPSSQPFSFPTSRPSSQPSTQPSRKPSSQPTSQPSVRPTSQPTSCPSSQPSTHPSHIPSSQPTRKPSSQPSAQPSSQPSSHPSSQPSQVPTTLPTRLLSSQPSAGPSSQPSSFPTQQPAAKPTAQPTDQPSQQPISMPSSQPTLQPSTQPTSQPSVQPIAQPSSQPSSIPSKQPNSKPSSQPTSQPTVQPAVFPSAQPTGKPSSQPTFFPSGQPTDQPTTVPSMKPTNSPTAQPSLKPSYQPSSTPTSQPSAVPSKLPSSSPSMLPTTQPTNQPSLHPTTIPSISPSGLPSSQPTSCPSAQPSKLPSSHPSACPTTQPSVSPSTQPSNLPSSKPSLQPTSCPTCSPSGLPTVQPFPCPSTRPTLLPSTIPSITPSSYPSAQPISHPTSRPTNRPSIYPSHFPSTFPSSHPSHSPSSQPTALPSSALILPPSTLPSTMPSTFPSSQPSENPSVLPSTNHKGQPSSVPSLFENVQRSSLPSICPSIIAFSPSRQPTVMSLSDQPTLFQSSQPTTLSSTSAPHSEATLPPTLTPPRTLYPSFNVSADTKLPSGPPSVSPSSNGTIAPSLQVSSVLPSQTIFPSHVPSVQPLLITRSPSSFQVSSAYPSQLPTPSPSTPVGSSFRPSIVSPSFVPSFVAPSLSSGSPSLPGQTSSTPARTLLPTTPSEAPTIASSFLVLNNKENALGFSSFLLTLGRFNPSSSVGMLRSIDLSSDHLPAASTFLLLGDRRRASPCSIRQGSDTSLGSDILPISDSLKLVKGDDQIGTSSVIQPVGDLNGDGFPDLVIGYPMDSRCIYYLGHGAFNSSYFSYGFTIRGQGNGDHFGWAIAFSSAGNDSSRDLNNDGISDLLISAPYSNIVYLLFGGKRFQDKNDLEVNPLLPFEGIKIIGPSSETVQFGLSLSFVGDFDGNGKNDVAISSILTATSEPAIFLILIQETLLMNQSSSWDITVNHTEFYKTIRLIGPVRSFVGMSLAGCGDLDGDGYDDLAIGSIPYQGGYINQRTYIVYGQPSLSEWKDIYLENLSFDGFVVDGGGMMVSGPGDINGDGLSDLLIVKYFDWINQKSNGYLLIHPPIHSISSPPSLTPSLIPSSHPSLNNGSDDDGQSPPSLSPQSTESYSPSVSARPSSVSHKPSHQRTSRPTFPSKSPSFMPTIKPTVLPTLLRTISPILITPSSMAPSSLRPTRSMPRTIRPSFRSTEYPTLSPVHSIPITNDNESSAFHRIVVNITGDYPLLFYRNYFVIIQPANPSSINPNPSTDRSVMIAKIFPSPTSGSSQATRGTRIYQIHPLDTSAFQENVMIVSIEDFIVELDRLDLSPFHGKFQSIEDLSYQTYPLVLILSGSTQNEQKIVFPGLKDFSLTESNIIFSSSSSEKDQSSLTAGAGFLLDSSFIVSFGLLVVFVLFVCCVVYVPYFQQREDAKKLMTLIDQEEDSADYSTHHDDDQNNHDYYNDDYPHQISMVSASPKSSSASSSSSSSSSGSSSSSWELSEEDEENDSIGLLSPSTLPHLPAASSAAVSASSSSSSSTSLSSKFSALSSLSSNHSSSPSPSHSSSNT